MRAGLLEGVLALEIDQRRRRIGKAAVRIGLGGDPLRLDEDRPAGAETAQRVVESGGDADQLGRRGAIEVRSAKARRALERAVLVEDDALFDQGRPGQEVGEAGGTTAIFGKVQHGEPHTPR